MINRRAGIGILGTLVLLWACEPDAPARPATDETGSPEEPAAASVPTILTVNYPLAWMTQRIVGDRAEVLLPVPPGTDPAHWQPSAETILRYQAADRVVRNGADYAGWLQFASLPPSRVVNASAGLNDRFIFTDGPRHSHGPEGDHAHGDAASHTWLDPTLAAAQAENIAAALQRITGPNNTELAQLKADLATLDTELATAFEHLDGTAVLYSHPVYEYLDARYALNGRSVTWEPDADPGDEGFSQLDALLTTHPAGVMLWEDEPLAATRASLAERGVTSLVFQTGARMPAEGDYLALMRNNARRLLAFQSPE